MLELFINRYRPALFSKLWFKYWAKRLYHAFRLLRILWIRASMRSRGSKLGRLTIVEQIPYKDRGHNLTVGDYSMISGSVTMYLHNTLTIGNNVCISEGAFIHTGSHSTKDPLWTQYTKPVVIEDYVWIAARAIIMCGVTIGRGAVIGAGAVVRESVPPGAVVTGNPAVVHSKSRPVDLDYSPVMFSAPFEAWLGPEAASIAK